MKKILCFPVVTLLFLLTVVACDSAPKPTAASAKTEAQSAPAPGAMQALAGRVLEVIPSGGYTYLQVETAGGPKWAAVPSTAVARKGDKIVLEEGMVMPNFHSKTLNRDFPEIVFSGGIAGQSAPAAAPATTQKAPVQNAPAASFQEALQAQGGKPLPEAAAPVSPAGGGSKKASTAVLKVKVQKAEGAEGYTVAELHAQRKKLAGKKIKVRGAVAKVSKNIMGRHWLHLQDGSGDAAAGSHDLTVTTSQTPPDLNDVVLVSGVLASDKDFGAGYSYEVILEEATFAPKTGK